MRRLCAIHLYLYKIGALFDLRHQTPPRPADLRRLSFGYVDICGLRKVQIYSHANSAIYRCASTKC